jgi:branched-subunit amino acid aminotransferase/4-amino-4-deoxychorismate lyase
MLSSLLPLMSGSVYVVSDSQYSELLRVQRDRELAVLKGHRKRLKRSLEDLDEQISRLSEET